MSVPAPSGSRPRPVLLYGIINTAVLAFLGGAGAVHLIPGTAVAVVALAWAVVGGGWAFYVQSVTTPVSSPQDARGVPLVAVDSVPRPASTGLAWTKTPDGLGKSPS